MFRPPKPPPALHERFVRVLRAMLWFGVAAYGAYLFLFLAVGVPGFQFVQDEISYGSRTHHSNMDNWDHAVAEDLQQAAIVMATFVWQTANRAEKLPRRAVEPRRGGAR